MVGDVLFSPHMSAQVRRRIQGFCHLNDLIMSNYPCSACETTFGRDFIFNSTWLSWCTGVRGSKGASGEPQHKERSLMLRPFLVLRGEDKHMEL